MAVLCGPVVFQALENKKVLLIHFFNSPLIKIGILLKVPCFVFQVSGKTKGSFIKGDVCCGEDHQQN